MTNFLKESSGFINFVPFIRTDEKHLTITCSNKMTEKNCIHQNEMLQNILAFVRTEKMAFGFGTYR